VPSEIDQRLAAAHNLRQIEAMIRLERIVESFDAIFDDAFNAVINHHAQAIAGSRLPVARFIFAPAIIAAIREVRNEYEGFAGWSFTTAVASLVVAVPRSFFRYVSPRLAMFESEVTENNRDFLQGVFSGDEEDDGVIPFMRQLFGEVLADSFTEPIALGSFKDLTPSQWQNVLEELVFPPPSPARSREILDAVDEQGFNFESRLEKLTRKADDADRVANEIAVGFSEGENLQELEKRVRPLVDGIKSSAKRVVRTEGLRIAERMQRETWEQLGDTMTAVQILATLDQNTRPAHALRNGRLHFREPTGDQLGLDTLPLLPDEPNCRCWSTPVLRPPPGFADNPALQAAFRNAQGAGIPDPATYDRWFSSVGERRRKLAVGSRRYDTIKTVLDGTRDPEWSDFINAETGELLPISELKEENALDRAERKLAVNALISARRETISQIASTGFLLP